MTLLKKYNIFIVLSLILACIFSVFIVVIYQQSSLHFLQQQRQQAQTYFADYDLAYQTTQARLVQISQTIAATQKIQSRFLAGRQAIEEENSQQQAWQLHSARHGLQLFISDNWPLFSANYNIEQLHFYFDSPAESFLHINKPQSTAVKAHYFPIKASSPVLARKLPDNSEIIGMIEVSTSFAAMLNALSKTNPANTALLLSPTLFDRYFPPINTDSDKSIINRLILAQRSHDNVEQLSLLNATKEYQSLSNNTESSIKLITHNQQTYLYAEKPFAHPLINDSAENTAKIIIWQNITDAMTSFSWQMKINILYSVLTFILIELLLYLTLKLSRRKQQQKYYLQTLELDSRNNVLEQLAQGKTLKSILESLTLIIEKELPSSLCSILLVDQQGKQLVVGAAPSLPDFYNQAINGGIDIAENIGSCGHAAFTKKRTVVKDIQSHPNWHNYKELAAKANLAACWSEPIISYKGHVLGTFALYYPTIGQPKPREIELIQSLIQLSRIVIEHKQAHKKLHLLSRIYEQTHEGISISDTSGKIIDVNPRFCDITAYDRQEIIGASTSVLNSGEQSDEFYDELWATLHLSGYWQGEVWNRKKNGELYAGLLTISSLQDDNDQTTHFIALLADITHDKQQQKALEFMAHYDALTKLPNRTLFVDRFQQAIIHSNRNQSLLAVCFLDLDEFKPVNDQHGHIIGDQLLIQVAERIKQNIREEDTVSRQGGDEFALLLGELTSPEEAELLIRRLNTSLAQPYIINEQSIKISASIGVSLYPLDNSDMDTLLRHADQAMYQAKLAGRNTNKVFNMEHDQQSQYKQTMLSSIQHAFVLQQFCLYYQPKINMKTAQVFGVEALIRWLHPEKGLIPPLDFLPFLDGTPLEIQIGDWVIDTALQQLQQWNEQGIELEVSVNISSHHLQSSNFVTKLKHSLARYPAVNSNHLQLEILESSALGDIDAISTIIKSCRNDLGVNFSLDDFGTGYSSLTHLRSLAVDTIKIDQSFVRNMLDDPGDFTIIEGIIGLSTAFNRQVIAEGVETIDQGLLLINMGCYQAQGYGISKPLASEHFVLWLQNYQVDKQWITCANTKRSRQESKIKLLLMTSKHWFVKLEDELKLMSEDESSAIITKQTKFHHGVWLQREQQELLFDTIWLEKLAEVYEQMHLVARQTQLQYQHNSASLTETEMVQMRAAYDDMISTINQYK